MKKSILVVGVVLLVLCVLPFDTFAQTQAAKGVTALNNVYTQGKTYVDPVSNIVLLVGVFMGFIGGLKVYSKFHKGEGATSGIGRWVGGCLFLLLLGGVLKALFL